MIAMIRTGCSSIEAALSSDEFYQKKKEAAETPKADDEMFLTNEQEDLIGQMLGLLPEKESEQDASKKPARKPVNEQKRLSTSKNI